MFKKLIKNNKEIININERYYTRRGKNTWDTNIYLVDKKEKKKYLIDSNDIIDEKYPEEGLIHWEDVVNLENIGELKLYSWKTKELEYNEYLNIEIL